MEIQRIELPAEDRKLLFDFMGDDPGPTIDFNWLMPVVERIENLRYKKYLYEIDGYNFVLNGRHAGVKDIEGELITQQYGKNKLEATYKAVVAFIKFYNDQKASNLLKP